MSDRKGAYYNENDKFAAAWLRELIKARLIADGEVDERSIADVTADDVRGFVQCHFFAGIGGWSYALRLAGWPDDRAVWTGSCPCQPWSVANCWEGGGQGDADERDRWPDLRRLLIESRPATFFGEQIADAVRWGWFDRACVELEAAAFTVAAAVLPALAVDADHERKRLYLVADAGGSGREGHQPLQRIPLAAVETFAVAGDSFTDARRAVAGDFSGLLPCDGLSVQLERHALKGYGNAIVPQVAQVFIEAYCEARG